MAFYGGLNGECVWTYFSDGISTSDWAAHIQQCETEVTFPRVRLTIAVNCPPPTASQRKALAQFFKENPVRLTELRASAFVVDSAVGRAALTAMGWLVPKPFPEKSFDDPREALRWLETFPAKFNPDNVLAAIALQVPASPSAIRMRCATAGSAASDGSNARRRA